MRVVIAGDSADGRANGAIARPRGDRGVVEKHIGDIFGKLGLAPSFADHRRVTAVLSYLRA